MDFHKALSQLTSHPVFKEWHAKNKDNYLAHAFLMLDDANKDTWQFGFYNDKKELMVTFLLSPQGVQHTQEQEVLKTSQNINKLNVQDVKLTPQEALELAKKCREENYKEEKPAKEFFIIQTLDEGTVFNITSFTQSLTTINIKIDAKTGKVLHHNRQKLMEFG